MISHVVEEVTHKSERDDLFTKVISHAFYYFWLIQILESAQNFNFWFAWLR